MHQETRIRTVKAPLFTLTKNWKQPKCLSTIEQINVFHYLYNIAIKMNKSELEQNNMDESQEQNGE